MDASPRARVWQEVFVRHSIVRRHRTMRSILDVRRACAIELADRASARRARVCDTAAHLVLFTRKDSSMTSHAPVVAARSESTRRATASFVENFSLAVEPVSDGIKHGTVRNETEPRMRAEIILPTTQLRGRQKSSSRVTPSRHAVLSPILPRTRPSRSDRTSVGCRSREDQGGPS